MNQCYFHNYFFWFCYRRKKSCQSGIYDEIKASNIDLPNVDQGEKSIYDTPHSHERKKSSQGAIYENLPHDQQSVQSSTASRDGQRKGSIQASGDRRRKRSFQSGVYEEIKETDDGMSHECQDLPCHSNPSYKKGLQLATTETSERMNNIYDVPEDTAA